MSSKLSMMKLGGSKMVTEACQQYVVLPKLTSHVSSRAQRSALDSIDNVHFPTMKVSEPSGHLCYAGMLS